MRVFHSLILSAFVINFMEVVLLKKNNKHDWLLYLLSLCLILSVALFIVTSRITLPLFDVSVEWTGNTVKITFTGIAQIIVAAFCGIGLMWRLIHRHR